MLWWALSAVTKKNRAWLRAEREARSEFFCGLTRALEGGCKKCPPPRFFADSGKNGGAQRRHFFSTCWELNYTPCVKISSPGHQRSGHQVRSKSKTVFWLWDCAVATLDIRLVSNLQCFIRSQIPTTCISRIFDICDQRSGQFRDLTIISQWAKI